MKKYIILLFLSLFTCGKWFAQGNLQFNQIINYNLTGNLNSIQTGQFQLQTISITVPANKVWKIESASCKISNASSYLWGANPGNEVYIFLDNNYIGIMRASTTSNNDTSILPLWLTAGNHTLQLVVDIAAGATQTAYGMVTGIEFNVVP